MSGFYGGSKSISVPNENYYRSFSYYTPVVLGALLPIGGTKRLFVGFETAVSHDEYFSSDGLDELKNHYSGSYLYSESSDYITRSDRSHYLVDAGVSWRMGSGYAGLRARVCFEDYEDSDGDSYETTKAWVQDFGDSYLDMRNNNSEFEFERLSTLMSVGFSGNDRLLRDLVFTVERVGYTSPVDVGALDYTDDDLDGNGIGFFGGSPYLLRKDDSYVSRRDYTELGFSARMHLDLGAGFRTVHYVGYRSGDGDGHASTEVSSFETHTPYDRLKDIGVAYDYDGSFSRVYALTTIGRVEEMGRGIMFAWGLSGTYTRWEFNEEGRGSLDLLISDEYYPDSLQEASPYKKNNHDFKSGQYLAIPFALEWKINKFIVLRLGAKLSASRVKSERSYRQSVDATDTGNLVLTEPIEKKYGVGYDVYSVFYNGVGIVFKDRLRIDLHRSYSGFDFAEYNFITARFSF